jgi:hypothetical protein
MPSFIPYTRCTAKRLQQLARQFAAKHRNSPQQMAGATASARGAFRFAAAAANEGAVTMNESAP